MASVNKGSLSFLFVFTSGIFLSPELIKQSLLRQLVSLLHVINCTVCFHISLVILPEDNSVQCSAVLQTLTTYSNENTIFHKL